MFPLVRSRSRSRFFGNAPTLAFNFVDGSPFPNQITFTRASTGTYFNSAGVLTSAAIDESRRDFDPATLAVRGLLIEEARTNSIRNNTMQGAVAPFTFPTNWQTVPIPGITATIVGIGTQNGIAYLDVRVSGTPTVSSFYNLVPDILVAGASGQTWTGSFWASLVAGSLTNTNANIEIRESDAAQGFLTNTLTTLPITSTLTRYSQTRTLNNASTAFVSVRFVWQVTNGLPVDFTLRIGLPQLEQGAFATSVIPTTTTALTRSADVASVNTLSPWYNQTEGTVYAELQSLSPLTGAQSVALNKYPHVWQIEAGASDSTLWWYGITSELFISTTFNNIGTVPSGINKFAVSLAPTAGQSRSSLNGAAAVNRNGTLTGTATLFSLGKDSTNNVNNFLNGYLRRLTYYPRALSAAELQAITA